jgi:hypothetical protein
MPLSDNSFTADAGRLRGIYANDRGK